MKARNERPRVSQRLVCILYNCDETVSIVWRKKSQPSQKLHLWLCIKVLLALLLLRRAHSKTPKELVDLLGLSLASLTMCGTHSLT